MMGYHDVIVSHPHQRNRKNKCDNISKKFLILLFYNSFYCISISGVLGMLFAPVTGGLSLGLTIAAIGTGIASGATTLTAAIVKDKNVRIDEKKIREAFQKLQPRDEDLEKLSLEIQVVGSKIGIMKSEFEKIAAVDAELEEKKTEKQRKFEETQAKTNHTVKVLMLGKKVFDFINGVDAILIVHKLSTGTAKTIVKIGLSQTNNIARMVQTDLTMKIGLTQTFSKTATDLSSGLKVPIIGKVIIQSGTTAAKVLSGISGAVSIAFGVVDIVGGAKDINYSEVAEDYRNFADIYEKKIVVRVTKLRKAINAGAYKRGAIAQQKK